MTDTTPAPRDYRDTVFLPKTDFPMKAGLPQKEPAILAKWLEGDLEGQIRASRAGRPQFILHDGPPYANGDMHIGHALNHILKDMVVRTQTLKGKDAPYVPGWDCHGLPIEWKVEEQYRKKKLDKDQVPLEEFRAECRAYARGWVDVQREQLKRLGIGGDWDHPYLTMDFDSEATIVAELLKFAASGQLYRGAKPVMWSPVEKTALAEAEIEYEDITSTQIDVAFEIVESPIAELVGAYAVIWTTTPWTIPVNQAIAYGPDVEYRAIQFKDGCFAVDNPPPVFLKGKVIVIAEALLETTLLRIWSGFEWGDELDIAFVKGSDLAGTFARHPMWRLDNPPRNGEVAAKPTEGSPLSALRNDESGAPSDPSGATSPFRGGFFSRPRPFLPGDFVTTDSGTGLVHMAPDHGEDDFDLCKSAGLEPQFAVMADGRYRDDWAWLGADDERRMSVINPKFNAPDGPICSDLREVGALLAASADYRHSYPHSWRSKAKVIYRCTPQWFVPMDKPIEPSPLQGRGLGEGAERSAASVGVDRAALPLSPALSPEGEREKTLRQTALNAIADTRFVPEKGRNRIRSMVEGRPDWVLSRQRAWGVPITLFVDRKTGQYLTDAHVNARIVAAIRESGVDAWSDARAQEYLGPDYIAADYERIVDILDVWFDSGSTHAFVLESGKWPQLLRRDGSTHVADLYLEGTDQHRGWFQSSLLESCGTRGQAPYKAVLTHGFTMDAKGMKMSKSLGNTISPIDLMKDYGADILRLWALSVDFTEDHRIGKEILAGVADQYRKLRNTFRYLLGALEGFSEGERVADVAAMPELERYMLSLLAELDGKLARAVDDFDFNSYTRLLSDFCNEDLSAFYFDIRKDSLYCDIGPAEPLGTDKRRAYRTVLDTLFHALVRYAAPVLVFTAEEVWATRFPDAGSVHLLEWPEMAPVNIPPAFLAEWAAMRRVRDAVSSEIEPLRRNKIVRSSLEAEITLPAEMMLADADTLAELFITAKVHAGDAPLVERTTHVKCSRCWRHLPEVTEDGALCGRCETVLGE